MKFLGFLVALEASDKRKAFEILQRQQKGLRFGPSEPRNFGKFQNVFREREKVALFNIDLDCNWYFPELSMWYESENTFRRDPNNKFYSSSDPKIVFS